MFYFVSHDFFSLNSFHSNLTDRHIKSMEFNVLDSLNTKLIRPVSRSFGCVFVFVLEIFQLNKV